MNVVEKSNNEDESVVWLKDELRKKGEEGEEREREREGIQYDLVRLP
mgnify:CR=1 FL=1